MPKDGRLLMSAARHFSRVLVSDTRKSAAKNANAACLHIRNQPVSLLYE